MISHDHHGASNHRRQCCLFNILFLKINKVLHHWPFLGIHRSTVESSHKEPVMRKMFPCYVVLMHCTTDVLKRLPVAHANICAHVTLHSWRRRITQPKHLLIKYWYGSDLFTGRELRSGVKCIVVTIVTGSLWLVRRYRWGQVNLKTISTIPSH